MQMDFVWLERCSFKNTFYFSRQSVKRACSLFCPLNFGRLGLHLEPSVKLKEPQALTPFPQSGRACLSWTVRALRAAQLFINILDPALVTLTQLKS